MQPGGGKIEIRWVSGAWSPGREEEKGRPGRSGPRVAAHWEHPPACCGWETQRERGWGGRPGSLSAEVGPLTSNDYCV